MFRTTLLTYLTIGLLVSAVFADSPKSVNHLSLLTDRARGSTDKNLPLIIDGLGLGFDSKNNEPGFEMSAAINPDDIFWDNTISPLDTLPTVDSTVRALTTYNNMLIIAGQFDSVGGIAASMIAAWDGTTWSALGSGLQGFFDFSPPGVHALTVYDGKLIAAGQFDTAGGVATSKIAAWDGTSWSALGTGMSGTAVHSVEVLTVYDGKLFAGGSFDSAGGVEARNIASWDGSNWSAANAGATFLDDVLFDLEVFGGNLIASGWIETGGGADTTQLALWNGSNWSAFNTITPVFNELYLSTFDNKLIVLSIGAPHITAWDGTTWTDLSMPTDLYGLFFDATEYDNKLYVGGILTKEIGLDIEAHCSFVWDGNEWSTWLPKLSEHRWVYAFTTFQGRLIMGGNFIIDDGFIHEYKYLAAGNGSVMVELRPTMQHWVQSMEIYNGNLIVGGNFINVDNILVNHVAAWNGSAWSALGTGIKDGTIYSRVTCFTVYDSKLIAGGVFATAAGMSANSIAAWDDISWSALGTGIEGISGIGLLFALTVYDGQLIAAGIFDTAGGVSANNIAAWNGTSWSALGSGMDDWIFALTTYNGELIAGGSFNSAGGTAAKRIASWDGTSWSDLGLGTSSILSSVSALTVFDNKLIAGGFFDSVGGVASNHIAAWDGTSWSGLGSGMNSSVGELYVRGGTLIAGGPFTTAGGNTANKIAAWDGSDWSPLGSGLNDRVLALTEYNSELAVGGYFNSAGEKPAAFLATWTKQSFLCGDVNNDGSEYNILDLTYLVDFIFRGGPAPENPDNADLNGDGDSANILDLTFLVDFIFRGGPAPTC